MARLIKVAYSGLTIGLGGNASITLTDRYRCSYSYPEFNFTAEVVVRSATRSTFLTAEAALIAAWRSPDQDLDVELGGTNRHSFAAASGTGFNARATCEKIGPEDTANASRYRISVTVQLPADLSGRAGRQSSSVAVDVTPAGKRTITVEGTYTATSSNPTAKAQYEAAVDAYCTDVKTAVGGTYELLTRGGGFRYDDQNRVLAFKRVYLEEFFNEGVGALTVEGIKGQSFRVACVTPPAPGDSSVTNSPLLQLRGTYSCWVDASVTTDLRTLYQNTIRPHLKAQMDAASGGTASTIVFEAPEYDHAENRITVTIDAAASTGTGLLTSRMEIEDDIYPGVAFAPVWSGDKFAADVYNVPALHIRTIRRVTVAITGSGAAGPSATAPSGFVLVRKLGSAYQDSVGTSADKIAITVANEAAFYRKVNATGGSAGGPGGSQVRGASGGGAGIFGIGAGASLDFSGGAGIFGIGSDLSLDFGP